MTANRQQSYEHWEPHDGKAALRNQITQTRADLGDTLSELAARTDVKARARQAATEARERTRSALRARVLSASTRTRGVARSGASSARHLLGRIGRSPLSVAAGGGAGALAGLGIYALLRRRLPLRWTAQGRALRSMVKGMPMRPMAKGMPRRAVAKGSMRAVAKGTPVLAAATGMRVRSMARQMPVRRSAQGRRR